MYYDYEYISYSPRNPFKENYNMSLYFKRSLQQKKTRKNNAAQVFSHGVEFLEAFGIKVLG